MCKFEIPARKYITLMLCAKSIVHCRTAPTTLKVRMGEWNAGILFFEFSSISNIFVTLGSFLLQVVLQSRFQHKNLSLAELPYIRIIMQQI